jgi:hypothetical protein
MMPGNYPDLREGALWWMGGLEMQQPYNPLLPGPSMPPSVPQPIPLAGPRPASVMPVSHEVSETIGPPETRTGYRNLYGQGTPKAGQPLPRVYPWERNQYATMADAVRAAQARSLFMDRLKDPRWAALFMLHSLYQQQRGGR